MTSSGYGAFFYLIVGLHALTCICCDRSACRGDSSFTEGLAELWTMFGAAEILWFFVVGIWPIIYAVVYL